MSKKTEGTPEDRCEIGKIVGVHGVRGDMLLLPQTSLMSVGESEPFLNRVIV